MIAGETEYLSNYSYNNFLGKKSKSEGDITPKTKTTFGQKLQKVGNTIDKAGGIEGIGRTVDSVRGLFKKQKETAPSDFQVNVGQSENNIDQVASDEAAKAKKKNLLLTGAAVIGGIILLGGLVLYVGSKKKSIQTV